MSYAAGQGHAGSGAGGRGGVSPAQGEDRQRVIDATDIVRLIGEHLALKKKGREYVCLCPFHDDHTPSMAVVPHKQIYHCFSCGAGGNAITFVMNYHKMSFREALEHLAGRSGITLAPKSLWAGSGSTHSGRGMPAAEHGQSGDRATLLSANATAQTFFRTILVHEEHGRMARDILEKRGVSPEMIERFQIGASPDRWDGLALTIASKDFDIAPFRAVGLLKARENGPGLYDALRNRVIFPIQDQIGRVIGFGGRRINDEDEPKYINSPESAVFDKSSTLYGLHQAAQEIRRTRVTIVTEGYMDTIACHQAGVTNAVATLGTSMTVGNARILKRLCDTVVLLFDGDTAGQRAAERAVEVFFVEPVDVRIATLSSATDAKDPDELLKRPGGVETLKLVIERAIDPLELLLTRVKSEISGLGLSARSRMVQEFAARLVDLGIDRLDKVRYQFVIKKLAAVSGTDWETIAGVLGDRRARTRLRSEAEAAQPQLNLTANEHLLACIMCDPSLTLALDESQWPLVEPAAFGQTEARRVAELIMEIIVNEQSPSLSCVLQHTDDPELQRVATRLASEIDRVTGGDSTLLKKHWRERLRDAAFVKSRTEAPASPPPTDAQSLALRLGELKQARKDLGHDPRAVPRPAT